MPPKIDWSHPDAVHLLNIYCIHDHLPPRHFPDGVPRTMDKLGFELSEIFGININRSALQYQLPIRRYALWKAYDPQTCPPANVILKKGALKLSQFFQRSDAIAIVQREESKNAKSVPSSILPRPSLENKDDSKELGPKAMGYQNRRAKEYPSRVWEVSPTSTPEEPPCPISPSEDQGNLYVSEDEESTDDWGSPENDAGGNFKDAQYAHSALISNLPFPSPDKKGWSSNDASCPSNNSKDSDFENSCVSEDEDGQGCPESDDKASDVISSAVKSVSRYDLDEHTAKRGKTLKPYTWALSKRGLMNLLVVTREDGFVDVYKINKAVGTIRYAVCTRCNASGHLDIETKKFSVSEHLKTCQKQEKAKFDAEQQKIRNHRKRKRQDVDATSDDDGIVKCDIESKSTGNHPIFQVPPPKAPFEIPIPKPIEKEKLPKRVPFELALNSKLSRNMIVTSEDGIKLYTVSKRVKGISYAYCNNCHITVTADESFLNTKAHQPNCVHLTREKYIDDQANRYARLLVTQGEKPQLAYRIAFEAALKLGQGSNIRPYAFSKTQLARWAKKSTPICPKTLISGDRWLLLETEKVELYCTDNALREMASCQAIIADGTFQTSPTEYYQVLTLHGLMRNLEGQEEYNQLCFALMRDKKQDSYNAIVDALLQRKEELNLDFKIEKIVTDYEPALQNAMKRLVGDATRVRGCLFHFSQAVLRQVGHIGLYEFYNLKVKGKYRPEFLRIRIWIRIILALPCLPKKDMQWLWKFLKRPPSAPDGVTDWPWELLLQVADYMDDWILREDETCSFFDSGRVRNTNSAESLHAAQKHIYPTKPRKEAYLNLRRIDAEIAEVRYLQLKQPGTAIKPCSKFYANVRKKVHKLESDYVAEIDQCLTDEQRILFMLRFARRSSALLHDTVNKSGTTKKNAKKRAAIRKAHDDSVIWRKCLNVDELFDEIVEQDKSMLEEDEADFSDGVDFDNPVDPDCVPEINAQTSDPDCDNDSTLGEVSTISTPVNIFETQNSEKPLSSRHPDTPGEKPVSIRHPDTLGEKPLSSRHPDTLGEKPLSSRHPDTPGEKPVSIRHPDTLGEKPVSIRHPDTLGEKPVSIRHPDTLGEKPVSIRHPDTLGEKPLSSRHPDTLGEKPLSSRHPDTLGEVSTISTPVNIFETQNSEKPLSSRHPDTLGEVSTISTPVNIFETQNSEKPLSSRHPDTLGEVSTISTPVNIFETQNSEKPLSIRHPDTLGEKPLSSRHPDTLGEKPVSIRRSDTLGKFGSSHNRRKRGNPDAPGAISVTKKPPKLTTVKAASLDSKKQAAAIIAAVALGRPPPLTTPKRARQKETSTSASEIQFLKSVTNDEKHANKENMDTTTSKPKCHYPSMTFLMNLAKQKGFTFEKCIYDAGYFDVTGRKPVCHNVRGDGNCGYRAISYALTGTENNHAEIRLILSEFLVSEAVDDVVKQTYKDLFASYFGDKVTYSKDHRLPATNAMDQRKWMRTEDIVAACFAFRVNILLYNGDSWSIFSVNFLRGCMTELVTEYPTILIFNESNIHYQAVIKAI